MRVLVISDFTAATPDLGWVVVNDDVMGGRSVGGFELNSGELLFSGRTNTQGGGFSSIRTAALRLDLAAYAGLQLSVHGDGRRYTWRLQTDARWRGQPIGYRADFDTAPGQWLDVQVPFSAFVSRFRGRTLAGPPLDPARIEGMGLMIYDGLDGPFTARLRRIEAR